MSHALRCNLLDTLSGVELQHETIVSTDVIDWIICKNLKFLRIKLIEDVSEQDMLRYIQYCPQLLSLNLWDFEADAQAVLHKSRRFDDSTGDTIVYLRELDEQSIATILQTCKQLKCLRVIGLAPTIWFTLLLRMLPHCAQFDENKYQETDDFLDEVDH